MIEKRGQRIIVQNDPKEQQIRRMLDQALRDRPMKDAPRNDAVVVLKAALSSAEHLTQDDGEAIMSAVVELLYRSLEDE